MQRADGEQIDRKQGTPQGGVISPLLANIFMHHAFDGWMERHFPTVKFERYADDALPHCSSLSEAEQVLESIKVRLKDCGLELNEEKTKLLYCKDADRRGSYTHESLDFLGYTFRPRLSKNRCGKTFVNFSPAISNQAVGRIGQELRSWKLHLRSDKSLTDLARMFNTHVQGRVNYYGRFYKWAMYPVLKHIEGYLIGWVTRKYKRYQGHRSRANHWLGRVRSGESHLFVHWRVGLGSPVG